MSEKELQDLLSEQFKSFKEELPIGISKEYLEKALSDNVKGMVQLDEYHGTKIPLDDWDIITPLDDIIMAVQNEIAATKLTVVSAQEGFAKVALGESVLTPNIHVSTEKWNGGHTYITITFYDYDTGQSIAVLKSSGIGLSISQDQNIALRTIRKNLKNVF